MLSRFRSPPLSVFLTGLPTMLSRRSFSPSSISFPSSRRVRSRPGEMRRANGRRELQVLADGEVLVERVLLRDVADVALKHIEVFVKRAVVQEHLALRRLKLAAQDFHERALAGTARAHHADELAAIYREGNPFERDLGIGEAMVDVDHFERPNDVAFFFDDSFGKIAAQKLADIDPDGIAVLKGRGRAHRSFTHEDRSVGVDHFQRADALVVIAKNFQEHVAARPGREQNVVFLEHARVVRNEIFRLRSLELEPATHGPGAPAQVDQVHLAVVMKNDPIFQGRFDRRAGLQFHAVEHSVHVAERFHPHLQAEGDFERGFARTRALQLHFVCVLVHAHEDLRQGNVFLRVEIGGELLVSEELVADKDALSGINPAETSAQERPAPHRDRLAGVVLEQDQIVITKGEEPIIPAQTFQDHVGRAVGPKGKRFQRRRAALVNGAVGIFGRIQLINDIDRLRRHAEL